MDKYITTSKMTAERIKKYLSEGKRFDGRGLTDFRDIKIETGISKNAEGSVKVTIGNTQVIAGVKMAVGTPYDDSPDAGNFMVTADLLPLSSPRFESGPPKFPAIELGRVIDRGLRESKFIDFKGLCIKEGEKVWTVFVDIFSLNDDGNLLDAAGIAALVAMKIAKIPKFNEETGKVVYGEWTDKGLPLSEEIPIAITAHRIGDKIIMDPTREEEDISDTRVTIGSSHGSISSMQKGNSKPLSIDEVNTILDNLDSTWKQVYEKIKTSWE